MEFKTSILVIMTSAAAESNSQLSATAVKGFAVILGMPGLLDNDNRSAILSLLSDRAFCDSSEIR